MLTLRIERRDPGLHGFPGPQTHWLEIERWLKVRVRAGSEDETWALGVMERLKPILKKYEYSGRLKEFPDAAPSVVLYTHDPSEQAYIPSAAPAHVTDAFRVDAAPQAVATPGNQVGIPLQESSKPPDRTGKATLSWTRIGAIAGIVAILVVIIIAIFKH